MRIPKPRVILALLCGALLSCGPAHAGPDSNQALIDLLVRKGVLTAQDVADLRTEIAAQKPASPVPSPSEAPLPTPDAAVPVQALARNPDASPLSFRIGVADFTPFGFMDFTTVHRSTNVGIGISTNFVGIP